MQNAAGKKDLDYTLVDEKHQGYQVKWAVRPSWSSPGKWIGSFNASKEGETSIAAWIANLYNDPVSAEKNTIQVAKTTIDGKVAAKDPH